jgi:Alginate lyase
MQRLRQFGLVVSVAMAPFFSVSAQATTVACSVIAPPAKELATQSKYSQSDESRSTVMDDAFLQRNTVLVPIRQSIAALGQFASASEVAQKIIAPSNDVCIKENIIRWARAGSLTQMNTADAYLARDRFMAEILLTLMSSAKNHPMNADNHKAVADWLAKIADQTIEFYEYRAGQKSKMNNHRYWAGLSVGATGFFLGNATYEDWGKRSFELGVCQVDASGFLPLELSRGALALDYHIYALRPLQAMAKLAAAHGKDFESDCNGGLKRLRDQTLAAIDNPAAISERTGEEQIVEVRDTSFIAPLQLASLSLLKTP